MEKVANNANVRISQLREKMLCLRELCADRGYWVTESYKETEGEPVVIRRAKALAKVLNNMNIHIHDGELIVGSPTSKQRGGSVCPEGRSDWWLGELETLTTRDFDQYTPLSDEEKARMKEFLPYWKGKSLYDKWLAMVPEDIKRIKAYTEPGFVQSGAIHCEGGGVGLGHSSVDYEMVLTKGLNGIKSQVDSELAKLNLVDPKDFQKYLFLNAIKITLDAAVHFAKRYADLANSLAKKEKNAQRKVELEKIAEICAWVPGNPARSFHEALQSIWFIWVILMIEATASGMSFGRPDQYLYQFYKKDMDEERITKEEAIELISLLYIQMNGLVMPSPTELTRSFIGNPLAPTITLGGLTRDGKDAVNELSYLFLDAEKEAKLSVEDFIIRIHTNTPDAFIMKACEVAKLLRGKIKFVGDETNILRMLNDGKPLEYARDYIIAGCFTPTVSGYSSDTVPGGMLNLPLMLELALNNGASRLTGEQIGPKTGDPRKFGSYEEVWEAYKKQVEAMFPILVLFKNINDQLRIDFAPSPFQSALFHGCIEKGLDINSGGTAPYFSRAHGLTGAPNVGDSLAAIKKAVFEDKKISMDRLIDALNKNFEGEDEILHILNSCPKFGNDDDYVDSIVNDVLVHGADVAAKMKGVAGALSTVAAAALTANVQMGHFVGALPDGKKAREPLSEGGISPYQGRNISGPTATMKSVAKLNLAKLTNGSVLNMRFNPDVFKDDSKMRKFVSLIRTFLESGGGLVQFNIVSTETLRDAQKYPEKYKDLLVRVATYSAYFVEISPELQNDIINRMEFEEI